MKITSIRNPLLALIAVGALLAFILACSSFSPDDSKVLYPTIDPVSGVTAVAVYDRETGRSETCFIPFGLDVGADEPQPLLLRPQWLAGGREIAVAWPWVGSGGEAEEDGLNLAVLPISGDGPTRLLQFPELTDTLERILYPLPIAGSGLFLPDRETNEVIRFDLLTGTLQRLPGMMDLVLLPTSRADRLLYLGRDEDAEAMEVGWMQTDTGRRTLLFQSAPLDLGPDEDFFAVSLDGRRFAYLDKDGEEPVCRLRERDRPDRILSLGPSAKDLTFGHATFSPDGEVLFISILAPFSEEEGRPGGLGFLEVPVNGLEVRRTILVPNTRKADYDTPAYFEIGLSGDGQLLAAASTYYAYEQDVLSAETCALFLVDLTDPQRAFTKVPVPLPPNRDETME
jgi:hypothetical protein